MPGSFNFLSRMPVGGVPIAAPAIDADQDPLENVGRRSAPRLRLSIPARLVTVCETRHCVLLDVSRTGAQIGLAKPLDVGDAGLLHFAGFEVFGCAIRAGTGHNGLEFDIEMSDAEVLATRHYAESYEADKRGALMDQARAWVMGSDKA